MIFEDFHRVGKQPVERDRLKTLQRDEEVERLVFLSICEDMSSGPVEVLTLRDHTSLSTSSSEHWIDDNQDEDLLE